MRDRKLNDCRQRLLSHASSHSENVASLCRVIKQLYKIEEFCERLLRVLTSNRVETAVMPGAPIQINRFKKVMQIFNVNVTKCGTLLPFFISFLFFLTGLISVTGNGNNT